MAACTGRVADLGGQSDHDLPKLFPHFFEKNTNERHKNFIKTFSIWKFNFPFSRTSYKSCYSFTFRPTCNSEMRTSGWQLLILPLNQKKSLPVCYYTVTS